MSTPEEIESVYEKIMKLSIEDVKPTLRDLFDEMPTHKTRERAAKYYKHACGRDMEPTAVELDADGGVRLMFRSKNLWSYVVVLNDTEDEVETDVCGFITGKRNGAWEVDGTDEKWRESLDETLDSLIKIREEAERTRIGNIYRTAINKIKGLIS